MQPEGFSAISWAGGWEIAFLGFLIVFMGLGLLAAAISVLHRVLDFFEKKEQKIAEKKQETFFETASQEKPVLVLAREKGLRESYQDYALLSEIMPSPLSLSALLEAASGRGVRRCHAVLADLLKAGVLKADGKGYYLWDQALFEALMGGE